MKLAFFHQYLEKLFTLLNSSPHVRVFRILQLYHPRVYLPRHLFQQEKFKSIHIASRCGGGKVYYSQEQEIGLQVDSTIIFV